MMPKTEAPADEPWQADLGHVFMAKTHGREAEPGIVFLGHMDTVFPKGTAQARPFKIEGDRATGPGVADMKAGLVANLFAARALKRLGLIDCPMTLMFSPDEELGSPSASRTLAQVLPGARAAINSEPGGPGGLVTVSRKGSGHMFLKVQGKASHAGRCYADGASAILEIAHKTLAIDTFLDLDRGLTVNTGLISGGVSANSVAPWAESRIHLTYRTLEDGQKVVAGIRDAVSRTVIPERRPPSAAAAPLSFERCKRATSSLACQGRREPRHVHQGPALRQRVRSRLQLQPGVPTICNMGPEGEHIHPQRIPCPSSIVKRCKLIALTALQASRVSTAGQ
ncbi:MAG: M20/M25/M40 family metallo-hydrolase [Bilophila wadsworthia]